MLEVPADSDTLGINSQRGANRIRKFVSKRDLAVHPIAYGLTKRCRLEFQFRLSIVSSSTVRQRRPPVPGKPPSHWLRRRLAMRFSMPRGRGFGKFLLRPTACKRLWRPVRELDAP